jgi:hypothetical protein
MFKPATPLSGTIYNANYNIIRYSVSVQSSTLRPITKMSYGLSGSFVFSVFSDQAISTGTSLAIGVSYTYQGSTFFRYFNTNTYKLNVRVLIDDYQPITIMSYEGSD